MATVPVPRQAASTEDPVWHAVDMGERAAAVFLLAASSPILIASAAILCFLSRRSPLIAHRRAGWHGETLWMLKLRTMWSPSNRGRGRWVEFIDDDNGFERKQEDDVRIGSTFARFCRRHSIDEIPQLWHVIRGEMSLVGPRPMTPLEIRRYYGADTDEVLRIKPGIAGLWQTSGRNRLTYAERRELDIRYVRGRTLAVYTRILMRTLPEIWSGENSW